MIEIIGTGLNQWDTGRSVKVTSIEASHVHFANPGDSKAPIIELVDSEAKIPDYLLQTGKQLCVYAVANGVTIERNIFPVKKREKPADYIYTETEILIWESLDERIKKLEETGSGGGIAEGAVLYTPQTLTAEQKAQARENIGAMSEPAVTVADAGKFLRVSADGVWEAQTVTNAEEVAY